MYARPLTRKGNINVLKNNLLTLARSVCPVKTGNLKYNGIFIRDYHNGFAVMWDDELAYYMKYVDKGTRPLTPRKRKNKGFVKKGLTLCLAYLNYYNEKSGNIHKSIVDDKFRVNNRKVNVENDYEYKRFLRKVGCPSRFAKRSLNEVMMFSNVSKPASPTYKMKYGNPYIVSFPKKYKDQKFKCFKDHKIEEVFKNAYKSLDVNFEIKYGSNEDEGEE